MRLSLSVRTTKMADCNMYLLLLLNSFVADVHKSRHTCRIFWIERVNNNVH